jgi:hypothetical protein
MECTPFDWLTDDIDAAGGLPVVDTCPDLYEDTVDMPVFVRVGSWGGFVSEEAILSELRASALFCRFAKDGMWRSGFEVCVCNGGCEGAVVDVVLMVLPSFSEELEVPRLWKECL